MLPAILICAFMVKNVATQTVTATLGLTKSCVRIGDDVKLLCTVSSGCCSSSRIWEKGSAIELLNDGISTLDPSKYVEEYYAGSTRFNLIIKNVQTSDFGVKYKCLYSISDDDVFLSKDYLCDCGECAGQDYGWSIVGDVIGAIIILLIAKIKLGKPKTALMVGGLTFIISAVVNIPIAVPIGYVVCHCVDGTDPVLIVLGFGTSMITGMIALIIAINKLKQESAKPTQDPASGKKMKQGGDHELKEKM